MNPAPYITVAVEGELDSIIVQKLIEQAGGKVAALLPPRGKPAIRKNIERYNSAARHALWIVVVDLNNEYDCAPSLLQEWLPEESQYMCFRVAVREIEAWLMGDAETLADYLKISRSKIERNPESLSDPKPKVAMVNLARESQSREIRERMVSKNGNSPGPYYTAVLSDYAHNHWRPEVAAKRADSLRRAMACVENLLKQAEFAG